MSDTSETLNQVVQYLSEETLNKGRIFTCFTHNFNYGKLYASHSDMLPNEILLKIFQYLSLSDLRQCKLVSKRWRALSLCSTLWQKVRLFRVTLGFPYLKRLINNCGVQQLYLHYSHIMVDDVLLLTRYFESYTFETLQYLEINRTNIETALLEVIVSMVPNLKCFIFKGIYVNINENIFSELLHLKFLKKLHLFGVCLNLPKIINMLDKLDNVMSLQSLGLGGVPENVDNFELSTKFVEKYLGLCPNLESLELISFPQFYINDEIFKLLAELKHLKSLDTHYVKIKVTFEAMEILNQNKSFIHLKELRVNCKDMEEKILILLLRASLNVEILCLYRTYLTTSILKEILSMNYIKKLCLHFINLEFPVNFLEDDKLQKFDNKLTSLSLQSSYLDFMSVSKISSLFKYLSDCSIITRFGRETLKF